MHRWLFHFFCWKWGNFPKKIRIPIFFKPGYSGPTRAVSRIKPNFLVRVITLGYPGTLVRIFCARVFLGPLHRLWTYLGPLAFEALTHGGEKIIYIWYYWRSTSGDLVLVVLFKNRHEGDPGSPLWSWPKTWRRGPTSQGCCDLVIWTMKVTIGHKVGAHEKNFSGWFRLGYLRPFV